MANPTTVNDPMEINRIVPASISTPRISATDAELQAFYRRNVARFTVPERRVIRYARVTPEMVKAAATPTDAEVAAASDE